MNIGERRLLEIEEQGAGKDHTIFAVCKYTSIGWALEHEPYTVGPEKHVNMTKCKIVAIHPIPRGGKKEACS